MPKNKKKEMKKITYTGNVGSNWVSVVQQIGLLLKDAGLLIWAILKAIDALIPIVSKIWKAIKNLFKKK